MTKLEKIIKRIFYYTERFFTIIATPIAIIGLIIAWISLSESDNDQKAQINKLNALANESFKHTKLLTNQLETLTEELEFLKEQKKQNDENRFSEIKPKLVLEFKNYNGDIISASLINNGKSAKIIKVITKKPNDFTINIPFQNIGEGKEKGITFRYKKPEERNEKTTLYFTLIYEDIDKKIHSKDFRFSNIEEIINEKYKNDIVLN
ncbi:MAG: hypothetical protein PHV20_07895 [Bacteroidales bacterium]|nr:hypothetical protein [Bacteroidales bacterium]